MLPKRSHVVPVLLLLAAAAAVAAAAVILLPERWVRWTPAAVGAGWTLTLAVLGRRLRAESGGAGQASLPGVVACGFLTVLAAAWALRGQVGGPELLLLSAALVAFGFWARALARERKRRRLQPPTPPGPVLRLHDRPRSPRSGPHGPQRPVRRPRTRWM